MLQQSSSFMYGHYLMICESRVSKIELFYEDRFLWLYNFEHENVPEVK